MAKRPKIGDIVVFRGYADAEGSSDGKFKSGDRLSVQSLAEEGGLNVRPLDQHGKPLAHGRQDETVYPDELEGGTPKVVKEKKSVVEVPDSPAAMASQALAHEHLPVIKSTVSRILIEGEDAIDAARRLSQKVQEDFFTLGELLHHIKSNNIHAQRGYDGKRGWQDFVAHELHEVDYRKAQYLISIYLQLSTVGIDSRVLAEIGWSKAKEIARVARRKDEHGAPIGQEILARDVKHLLASAKDMRRDDFVAYIETNYMAKSIAAPEPAADPGAAIIKRITFKWDAPSRELVANAIVRFRGDDEKIDDGEALKRIVERWQEIEAETLEQALERIQARFGVAVTAG